MTKPGPTFSQHILNFSALSAEDFERLCLWLLRDEGFETVQHTGAAGKDQGVDFSACRDGQHWICQCKRVRQFGPREIEKELAKIQHQDHVASPDVVLFIVTSHVSPLVRKRAHERLHPIPVMFWAMSELDERVKRHPRVLAEFFGAATLLSMPDLARDDVGFPVQQYLEALDGLAVKQRVDALWVPLAGQYDGGRGVDAESFVRAWATDKASRRLAVLGDYGTGKSWLCIRLARYLAQQYRSGLGALPLLLDLRSYCDGMTLSDLLPEVLYRSYGLANSNTYRIHAGLENGRITLILDGVDEMAREIGVRSALVQFERLGLPRTGKTLVTCRTHYFLSGSEQRGILQPNAFGLDPHNRHFQILHLQLMDRTRIAEALERRAPDDEGKAVKLFANDTYNLSELCSRPVFLSLVCDSYGSLARVRGTVTAADLYESYLEEWLRRELASGRIDISPETLLEFLEEIAALLFPRNTVWLSTTEFTEQVQGFAARVGVQKEAVASLVRKLATGTVLSRSMGDGWAFGHRSFQEYLYARRFFRWEATTGGQGGFPVVHVPAWQFIAQLVLRRWTRSKAEQWIDERVDRRDDPTLSLTTLRAAAAYRLIHSQDVRSQNYPLDGIMLDSVDLRSVDLSGATIRRADLNRSNLSHARLIGANLRDSILEEVNFTGADLTGTDLTDANLTHANLTGTNLTRVNVTRANMTGVNLKGATYTRGSLQDAIGVPKDV